VDWPGSLLEWGGKERVKGGSLTSGKRLKTSKGSESDVLRVGGEVGKKEE